MEGGTTLRVTDRLAQYMYVNIFSFVYNIFICYVLIQVTITSQCRRPS